MFAEELFYRILRQTVSVELEWKLGNSSLVQQIFANEWKIVILMLFLNDLQS